MSKHKDRVFRNGDEAAQYFAPSFKNLPLEQLTLMAAALWTLMHGVERDGKFVIPQRCVRSIV